MRATLYRVILTEYVWLHSVQLLRDQGPRTGRGTRDDHRGRWRSGQRCACIRTGVHVGVDGLIQQPCSGANSDGENQHAHGGAAQGPNPW